MKRFWIQFVSIQIMVIFISFVVYAQETSLESLNNSVIRLYKSGNYWGALQAAKKALTKAEDKYGQNHPNTAVVLNNLGMIYKAQAQYSEAEFCYRRSLAINEKYLGKTSLDVANILNNLGVLCKIMGRFEEAEKYYIRALEIKERNLEPNSNELANTLQNIGALYNSMGDFKKAENFIQRALKIRKNSISLDDYDETISLNSLALLYQSQGKYAQAESLLVLSLNMRKASLGETHINIAPCLYNLAAFYQSNQRYTEAKKYLNQALNLLENNLGSNHPQVGIALHNSALLEIARRNPEAYQLLLKRKFSIEAQVMHNVFSYASEQDKLAFMRTLEYGFDLLQSAVLQENPSNQKTITMGFNTTLQRKSVVLDALSNERRAILSSDNPELLNITSKLTETSTHLASLTLSGPGDQPVEEYKNCIDSLNTEREHLESELARLSSIFASDKEYNEVDVKQINKILNSDVVLIEFVRFSLYDFQKKMEKSSRYIAYILIRSGEPQPVLVDLGNADIIDQAIHEFRKEIALTPEVINNRGEQEAERRIQEKGKYLYNLIFSPLNPHIFPRKALYICPDGDLNLLPFGVICDNDGSYLIEQYKIHYLSSGRDLIRFGTEVKTTNNVVIIVNPDYDVKPYENNLYVENNAKKLNNTSHNIMHRSIDLKTLNWSELPGTQLEAEAISKKLSGKLIDYYFRENATEEVIKTLNSPSILHIATHGFFLNNQYDSSLGDENVNGNIIKSNLSPDKSYNKISINFENPLLRSGLVFAGANHIGEKSVPLGKEDGILTALEISGLNLWGTDLVVLSACETGLGEIHKGEGVFGLRRSFQLGGVRTLIMSMWEIPDIETIELMSNFYEYLMNGYDKSDALHSASLRTLNDRRKSIGNSHPFFWGAFVCVGEP